MLPCIARVTLTVSFVSFNKNRIKSRNLSLIVPYTRNTNIFTPKAAVLILANKLRRPPHPLPLVFHPVTAPGASTHVRESAYIITISLYYCFINGSPDCLFS